MQYLFYYSVCFASHECLRESTDQTWVQEQLWYPISDCMSIEYFLRMSFRGFFDGFFTNKMQHNQFDDGIHLWSNYAFHCMERCT